MTILQHLNKSPVPEPYCVFSRCIQSSNDQSILFPPPVDPYNFIFTLYIIRHPSYAQTCPVWLQDKATENVFMIGCRGKSITLGKHSFYGFLQKNVLTHKTFGPLSAALKINLFSHTSFNLVYWIASSFLHVIWPFLWSKSWQITIWLVMQSWELITSAFTWLTCEMRCAIQFLAKIVSGRRPADEEEGQVTTTTPKKGWWGGEGQDVVQCL